MGRHTRDVGVTPTPEPTPTNAPEPYSGPDLRRIVRERLTGDHLVVTKHARDRMTEREMTLEDATNVMRGGHPPPDKYVTCEHGTYRYTLCTPQMGVVVAFDDNKGKMILVTVWRTP